MSMLVPLLVVATTVWVGADARGRRWPQGTLARSTGGWIFGCLVLWIIVLPFYLAQRGRAPKGPAGTLPPHTGPIDSVAQTSVAPPNTSVAPPGSTR